jgi:hypothetical protein
MVNEDERPRFRMSAASFDPLVLPIASFAAHVFRVRGGRPLLSRRIFGAALLCSGRSFGRG